MIAAGDGQMANCSGAVVSGLQLRGDGFLSVRAGPGTDFRELDRLRNGDEVRTCDRRGEWSAIVYGTSGTDCGVDRASPHKWRYNGPCRAGWVDRRWIRHVAG